MMSKSIISCSNSTQKATVSLVSRSGASQVWDDGDCPSGDIMAGDQMSRLHHLLHMCMMS